MMMSRFKQKSKTAAVTPVLKGWEGHPQDKQQEQAERLAHLAQMEQAPESLGEVFFEMLVAMALESDPDKANEILVAFLPSYQILHHKVRLAQRQQMETISASIMQMSAIVCSLIVGKLE